MTPVLRIARASIALAGLCLMLAPTGAHAAQGLNLRWTHCLGDGGVQNMAFACNTNVGTRFLHGSFELASAMSDVIGTEIILQLAADSPTLPAWWDFHNLGSCRQPAFSAMSTPDPTDVFCVDWTGGAAIGAIGAYCTVSHPCITPPPGANVAVIKAINAVQPDFAADLEAETEYYDFTLRMTLQRTVGAGSCAGCTVPVCIVLNSINVVALDNAEQRFISTPTTPGSNHVTWQGGGSPDVGGIIGCPAATPTRRSTWGAVKTLYR